MSEKLECKRSCGTFNTEDNDCEIFGETHPSPRNCPYFKLPEIRSEIIRRCEEKE